MDTVTWVESLEQELHTRRSAMPGRKPVLRRVRGRIALVTDAACGLPVDTSTGHLDLGVLGDHIRVVPIPVMIDTSLQKGQIYPESSPELARDLPLALAQGLPVRTSRPSPGRIAETYYQLHQAGFAGAVSIHLSAKLSGTVDAAKLAASDAPFPVTVVDSEQAGLGLGHAVIAAAMTARLGGTQSEVAQTAQTVAASSRSFFAVPSLEQLRRGGRIHRLASLLGSMMRVKPLLALREGEVVLLERTHSMPRALQRMSEAAVEHAKTLQSARLGVQCCGNPVEAAELADELQPNSTKPVPVIELPPGLAAHLGLGALGISVTAGG
ncbi:DegV family protein [Nesterenkonia natronophila]|uniref:DegV family protein n=1 Tax=Nesterenkonia natronophila TaxID=2174932 RepID=A0A3A4EZ41_9MICC|nr:DegV family protein [Nesterenkonia natronophila]RJN31152.1 DegV family protein [Nesterenkonia natronophila]